MNIESTTQATTKTALDNTNTKDLDVTKKEAAKTDAANTQNQALIKQGTTFKEQIAKNLQLKEQEALNAAEVNQGFESQSSLKNQQLLTQKNIQLQKVTADKLTKDRETMAESNQNAEGIDPISELNSKIAVLSNLKNNISKGHKTIKSGTTDKVTKGDYCQTMKMNNNDINFFVNLVNNQQMTAQNSVGVNSQNAAFTNVKSEATQQTVPVSAPLMDALNESFKTNKPFRIDFGGDVAVIMKVDKDGNLSANFIPGSAAVETYLKNNISILQQSFENQNLPYGELSYSKQQQQKQDKKENKDE